MTMVCLTFGGVALVAPTVRDFDGICGELLSDVPVELSEFGDIPAVRLERLDVVVGVADETPEVLSLEAPCPVLFSSPLDVSPSSKFNFLLIDDVLSFDLLDFIPTMGVNCFGFRPVRVTGVYGSELSDVFMLTSDRSLSSSSNVVSSALFASLESPSKWVRDSISNVSVLVRLETAGVSSIV